MVLAAPTGKVGYSHEFYPEITGWDFWEYNGTYWKIRYFSGNLPCTAFHSNLNPNMFLCVLWNRYGW